MWLGRAMKRSCNAMKLYAKETVHCCRMKTAKLYLTKLHHLEKTIQILVPPERPIRENLLSKKKSP